MRVLIWFLELCLAALVGTVVYSFATFPDVGELVKKYPQVVYYPKEDDFDVKIVPKVPPGWAKLNEISRVAVGAILVSEDWAFYSHPGYDWNQIQQSFEKNMRLHRFARGGSTITQQVARNIYLSQEKTLLRKGRELLIAIALEKTIGKKRILEFYLNIAEWGTGIFGIRAASEYYFHKPPSELTAREGAFLAMLLPSPAKYSVSFRKQELTPYARATMDSIVVKMVQAQYLAPEALEATLHERLSFEKTEALPAKEEPLDETVEDSPSTQL